MALSFLSRTVLQLHSFCKLTFSWYFFLVAHIVYTFSVMSFFFLEKAIYLIIYALLVFFNIQCRKQSINGFKIFDSEKPSN